MSDPVKAIGGMLKTLRPLSDGGQNQYQSHPVHSLSDEPSAAGFRQGFPTTLSLSLSVFLSPSLWHTHCFINTLHDWFSHCIGFWSSLSTKIPSQHLAVASGHWDTERPIHNLLHYSGELNLYSLHLPHDTQHIPDTCLPLLHRAYVAESFTIPSQHTLDWLRKQLGVLLPVGRLQHTEDWMDPLHPTSMSWTLHKRSRSPWTTSSTRSSNYIRAPRIRRYRIHFTLIATELKKGESRGVKIVTMNLRLFICNWDKKAKPRGTNVTLRLWWEQKVDKTSKKVTPHVPLSQKIYT